LPPSCELLAHLIFRDQIKKVIRSYPPAKKGQIARQITTVLNKIKDSPNVGKMMRDLKNEDLKGVIRRTYVGGPERHRFIYIYNGPKNLVLPVFLSKEPKRDFDYDKVPWEEIAEEIYNDFINKKYNKFMRIG